MKKMNDITMESNIIICKQYTYLWPHHMLYLNITVMKQSNARFGAYIINDVGNINLNANK